MIGSSSTCTPLLEFFNCSNEQLFSGSSAEKVNEYYKNIIQKNHDQFIIATTASTKTSDLPTSEKSAICMKYIGTSKGKSLVAEKHIPAGSKIFSELPLYNLQSLANSSMFPACEACMHFLITTSSAMESSQSTESVNGTATNGIIEGMERISERKLSQDEISRVSDAVERLGLKNDIFKNAIPCGNYFLSYQFFN